MTEKEDQFQIVNNWTKIRGNHTFKVGVDLRYARNLRVPSDNNRTGILEFEQRRNLRSSRQRGWWKWICHMASGRRDNFKRYVSTSTNAKEFQKRTFFYGQDTWRVNKQPNPQSMASVGNCTFPESVNATGNGALLNLMMDICTLQGYGRFSTEHGLGHREEADVRSSHRLDLSNRVNEPYFAPDMAAASTSASSVRSSDTRVTQNLPVLANQAINNATSSSRSAFTLDTGPGGRCAGYRCPTNGLLPNPGTQVNSRARPNPLRFPEIDAWNFAVQRAITPSLSLTMAYVGNKGTYTLGDSQRKHHQPERGAINLPAT